MSDANSTMIIQSLDGKDYALRSSPIVPFSLKKTVTSIIVAPICISVIVVLSLALLTPLRDRILARFIPFMMDNVAKGFIKERKTLLEDVRGRVLDLGSGGGAYLDHCHKADEVVSMEPVETMHPKIQTRGKDLKKLAIFSSLQSVMEDKSNHESFDWIILGNVLCEVDNVVGTLRLANQLLKSGGMIYFSEHVGCRRGTIKRRIQDAVNPLWKHTVGGCNCNRDSADHIAEMENWDSIAWNYDHIKVVGGPFKLGLARKRKN